MKIVDRVLSQIGATAFAVYTVLARHADNDTQQCFPSQLLIAEKVGISERSVRTCKHSKKQDWSLPKRTVLAVAADQIRTHCSCHLFGKRKDEAAEPEKAVQEPELSFQVTRLTRKT